MGTVFPLFQVEALKTPIIGPFSFSLDSGECIALTGPSGGGKSLFLRAICDLDPADGRLILEGREREEFQPSDWRCQVNLLPAEPAWWAERVGDHLNERGLSWLDRLGFAQEAKEWEVSRASSGERQRMALARMLALEPKVLLLDEPTANLDPSNRNRVESVIKDYLQSHDAAAVWVTHDPDQARRVAARALKLEQGCLESMF